VSDVHLALEFTVFRLCSQSTFEKSRYVLGSLRHVQLNK